MCLNSIRQPKGMGKTLMLPVQICIRIWRKVVEEPLKQKTSNFSVTCNHNRIRTRIKSISHLSVLLASVDLFIIMA